MDNAKGLVVASQDGDCPAFVDSGTLGRCERGLVDFSLFDGREFTQASLPTPPVVGTFDPSRDGQPEVLPGEPALTVQDVLCSSEQNDSIAALSAQAPTAPIDPGSPR